MGNSDLDINDEHNQQRYDHHLPGEHRGGKCTNVFQVGIGQDKFGTTPEGWATTSDSFKASVSHKDEYFTLGVSG